MADAPEPSKPALDLLRRLETIVGRGLIGLWHLMAWGLRGGLRLLGLAMRAVTGRPLRVRVALAAIGAGAALLAGAWTLRDGPINWAAYHFDQRPLLRAKSWYYHLDKIDVAQIAARPEDVIVMDHAIGAKTPLTPAQVERIRHRPDGRKRPVIAYMSIGEAEDFRWYWKPEWATEKDAQKKPGWLKAPNCAWPGAYAVRFWHPDWKKLIYGGPGSFLDIIIKAGFDGVYLDRVDIYEQATKELADPEAAMVAFVTELAAAGRAMKPGFLVIPQNAEDLLRFKHYRRVIDALGKEDLLHGHDGTGQRNEAKDIKWSYDRLRLLLGDHKPVFAVEYLVTHAAIAETRLELRDLGLVPTNAHRNLDGSDPTMPRFETKAAEGTPEYIKATCDKSNSW